MRRARKKRNISQEALAGELHVSRTSIVNIEAGRQRAPIHTLWRIAELLETDVATFLPRRDEFLEDAAPVRLEPAAIAQIEEAASEDPAARRHLMRFISRATLQVRKEHDEEQE